jgi:hypothetical protein
MSALPTITPSATRAMRAACSGVAIAEPDGDRHRRLPPQRGDLVERLSAQRRARAGDAQAPHVIEEALRTPPRSAAAGPAAWSARRGG